MKLVNSNALREKWTNILLETLEQLGEDVGQIASNSINFPVVAEDGEEGFVRIVIQVPKDNYGYEEREDYKMALVKKQESKKKAEEEKSKKIKRDKKRREEKQEEGL